MTKLEGDKVLSRTIRVYGIGDVVFEISEEGLRARIQGTKVGLTQSWTQLVESMNTPANVPSYLMGKPSEFLKHQLKKREESRRAKLTK
jgi:hypothetical protein